MAPNRFLSDLDFTKTQLAVYSVVILLSVESLNPVNIVCHVIPGLEPWHMATLAVFLMIYVFLKEIKQLLYFSVQTFCHSILSIFFREVEVIGLENIPRFGPVIFSINHGTCTSD
jgi:glycerol-3-phosphate O-acyltransferase / dihydroxyacetone phosphate acyltransferase